MALSGTEWNKLSVFDSVLRDLERKPSEQRTEKEQAVIDYFKKQIEDLQEKKSLPIQNS